MLMERKLPIFIIPTALVLLGAASVILIFLPFYNQIIMPFMRKFIGNPREIFFLQRIGVGLFLFNLALVAATVLEKSSTMYYSVCIVYMKISLSLLFG